MHLKTIFNHKYYSSILNQYLGNTLSFTNKKNKQTQDSSQHVYIGKETVKKKKDSEPLQFQPRLKANFHTVTSQIVSFIFCQ